MRARLLGFGSLEIDGRVFDHDVVIDAGVGRRRSKKPSKPRAAPDVNAVLHVTC